MKPDKVKLISDIGRYQRRIWSVIFPAHIVIFASFTGRIANALGYIRAENFDKKFPKTLTKFFNSDKKEYLTLLMAQWVDIEVGKITH